jgi:hypothetical protein
MFVSLNKKGKIAIKSSREKGRKKNFIFSSAHKKRMMYSVTKIVPINRSIVSTILRTASEVGRFVLQKSLKTAESIPKMNKLTALPGGVQCLLSKEQSFVAAAASGKNLD